MKRTRRLSHLLLLLLAIALPGFSEKVSAIPAPTGYIDDYAGVLSASGQSDMESLSRELHEKTKAQVFLVTIKTLDGEPVETFANQLFAKWKIGEKKTDRGVLILFSINDRKRWIEVGYGLEGILNDAKVGDIGRDMVPALRAANYDDAAKIGLQKVSQVIAADADVTLDAMTDPTPAAKLDPASQLEPETSQVSEITKVILAFTLFPAFIAIGYLIWRVRHNFSRTGSTGGPGFDGNSSSFGSSDSTFSSSSDDSFSGGDGGSSGGGGAGGDW